MTDPLEVIRAKRAEYQAELAKLQSQLDAFRGAVAAADDIINALEKEGKDDNQDAG
jgi:predicted  nucleic acid-binding Zn-ribbon protein